jgi:hypothetical protein
MAKTKVVRQTSVMPMRRLGALSSRSIQWSWVGSRRRLNGAREDRVFKRPSPPLCADRNGSSLHADVRCAADDRQALEQLCRYARRCKPSPGTKNPVDCLCLARSRATGPARPASGLTPPNTVQAARRARRWSRLDPSICRIDGIGLATWDKPQTAPEKRIRRLQSTRDRTQPPSKTDSRVSGALFGALCALVRDGSLHELLPCQT